RDSPADAPGPVPADPGRRRRSAPSGTGPPVRDRDAAATRRSAVAQRDDRVAPPDTGSTTAQLSRPRRGRRGRHQGSDNCASTSDPDSDSAGIAPRLDRGLLASSPPVPAPTDVALTSREGEEPPQ